MNSCSSFQEERLGGRNVGMLRFLETLHGAICLIYTHIIYELICIIYLPP